MNPPGAFVAPRERWGRFADLGRVLPPATLVLVDRRVVALHPSVAATIRRARPLARLAVRAGEGAKTLASLGRVLEAGAVLPRGGTLLCVGGGTVGDLGTVAAHLLKRGLSLIQVPTTLLAAVDSSLGGKGAVHVRTSGGLLKNGAGVFHYASETWLCPEFLETLKPRQIGEGSIEAWKMIACLDRRLWQRYRKRPPELLSLVREGRRLKARACARDPYEQSGARTVLNFGHTLGHVMESATSFRISHGNAVGLGILCALDVGRVSGVTPERVANAVEQGFAEGPGILPRSALGQALRRISWQRALRLLAGDKKVGVDGKLRMVLLRAIGRAEIRAVPMKTLRALWPAWQAGRRP